MGIQTRRVVVSVAAFIMLLTGPLFSLFGGLAFVRLLDIIVPPGIPGQNLSPRFDTETCWRFSFVWLSIAAAASFAFVLWDRRPTQRSTLFTYLASLLVLLPMSAVNFASGDSLMNRKGQMLLDVLLVICGSVSVMQLSRLRPQSIAGAVVQSLILFVLTLEAILVPGIYGLLFALNWQHLISLAATPELSPSWVTAFGSVVSAVFAAMSYLRERSRVMQGAKTQHVISGY
jgi:hypothetical protein